MIQTAIVYIALVLAVAFLVKKLFFSKKKAGCKTGCNC